MDTLRMCLLIFCQRTRVCGFNEAERIVHWVAGVCRAIMSNMFSVLCGANSLNKAV